MAPSRRENPAPQELDRIRNLARILDSAIRIPGTRIRVGADALIGLVPVAGDVIGLLLGLWLIWQGRQFKAPGSLQLRMIGNLLFETVIGSVPLVGDIFDVAWRANQRNSELLLQWAEKPARPQRPAKRWWPAILVLVLLAAGLLWQLQPHA